MASVRTQIYLTDEQHRRLGERARKSDQSMAAIIREAVGAYLEPESADLSDAAELTFGAVPEMSVPDRREWDEREQRLRSG